MRTDNIKVKNLIISIYFILIVIVLVATMVFKMFRSLTSDPILTFIILFVGFALLFVLLHQFVRYFEYDSDGPKVYVTNRGMLLSEKMNFREHKLEFLKENLLSYKLKNYVFYKSLTFYIKDSQGRRTKETFNVTMVTNKKLNYIRQSISKMVRKNKKRAAVDER